MVVTSAAYMTKVLRVKDETFEEIVKRGKWTETMDMIISRVLRQNGLNHIDKEDVK